MSPNAVTHRTIRKSASQTPGEIRDLLSNLLVSELIQPSRTLWVVSPWLTDLRMLGNVDGSFSGLGMDLPKRDVTLSEILAALVLRGTQVRLAVRPVPHNDQFLAQLRSRLEQSQSAGQCLIGKSETLHEKGLLTDHFYLGGSMNFTYGGVELLQEVVRLDTDGDTLAQAHLAFEARWDNQLAPLS